MRGSLVSGLLCAAWMTGTGDDRREDEFLKLNKKIRNGFDLLRFEEDKTSDPILSYSSCLSVLSDFTW